VDAVSCNCLDSQTGKWTGSGFDGDQYIDLTTSLRQGQGEHWGMFHRRILGHHRLNPRTFGFEGVLWTKIHEHARWFYLHRALRVYHTEGNDRITHSKGSFRRKRERMYQSYAAIVDEERDYLDRLRRLAPAQYARTLQRASEQFAMAGDRKRLAHTRHLMQAEGQWFQPTLLAAASHFSPGVLWVERLADGLAGT
jgi:hypothetical protein